MSGITSPSLFGVFLFGFPEEDSLKFFGDGDLEGDLEEFFDDERELDI
jgi:hypothetical protein